MTERNLETHPYSADEQRVAAFLSEAGAGGGDDPIGFILASHRSLAEQRNALRVAAKPFVDCVFNDNGDVTLTTTGLNGGHWLALKTAAEE